MLATQHTHTRTYALAALGVLGVLIILTVGALYYQRIGDVSPAQTPPVAVTPPKTVAPAPASPPKPTVAPPDYKIPPSVNGLAPVISTLDTKQNVVFLGIDDGAFKDPTVVSLMRQHHIKASLFLSKLFIAGNPDFFKQLTAEGSVVEDHTLSHNLRMVDTLSYQAQKDEICGMADYEEKIYGRRPTLYRPPGGAYSETMRRAAYDCGMKAIVTWIAKANGGAMQYQIGNKLRPGDIVLMHFRPEFAQDMAAFIAAQDAAGLHTELLENALGAV